ncbi:MAG: 30S ribosomal protein S6 [Pseudomonadota bacterium]
MAFYEHVIVSRPDISPQQVDALVEEITTIITENEGAVGKTEYWGLRNLSYPIKKSRKGHYSLLNIDAPAGAIHELERRLRINEDVLRYLTIRVEELSDEPSPILSRKDRDRGDRGDRGDRDRGERRPRRDRED